MKNKKVRAKRNLLLKRIFFLKNPSSGGFDGPTSDWDSYPGRSPVVGTDCIPPSPDDPGHKKSPEMNELESDKFALKI